MKHVAITGAAGQIAYSLIFRIANGELFGQSEPIALHLLDLPETINVLKGIQMELEDCIFPLVKEIHIGSNPEEVFAGVQYAFLVGSKPRGPNMERSELLSENGKIFVGQGKALHKVADKNVQILVVGNPCNTNCLILMHQMPDLRRDHFHAMTRLDHNRAIFQLAHKANVPLEEVTDVTIWGNHSSTQVPDFVNAKIRGKPVVDVIDRKWLETDFFTTVQKRGASVIATRGKSSAVSAANAALQAMRSIVMVTPEGHWFSSGVVSNGNPYGIADDLIFSFPCRSNGKGEGTILPGLHLDPFLRKKLGETQKELLEERDAVVHFLK
jgi:malate dehydrogenase